MLSASSMPQPGSPELSSQAVKMFSGDCRRETGQGLFCSQGNWGAMAELRQDLWLSFARWPQGTVIVASAREVLWWRRRGVDKVQIPPEKGKRKTGWAWALDVGPSVGVASVDLPEVEVRVSSSQQDGLTGTEARGGWGTVVDTWRRGTLRFQAEEYGERSWKRPRKLVGLRVGEELAFIFVQSHSVSGFLSPNRGATQC